MFEVITIPLAERSHLIDDVFVRIRNLNGVRLDVGYVVTLLLHVVLQVNHEQCATLGYDVILVARVSELIVELSRREAIHDVDNNLQRIGKVLGVLLLFQIWTKLTI